MIQGLRQLLFMSDPSMTQDATTVGPPLADGSGVDDDTTVVIAGDIIVTSSTIPAPLVSERVAAIEAAAAPDKLDGSERDVVINLPRSQGVTAIQSANPIQPIDGPPVQLLPPGFFPTASSQADTASNSGEVRDDSVITGSLEHRGWDAFSVANSSSVNRDGVVSALGVGVPVTKQGTVQQGIGNTPTVQNTDPISMQSKPVSEYAKRVASRGYGEVSVKSTSSTPTDTVEAKDYIVIEPSAPLQVTDAHRSVQVPGDENASSGGPISPTRDGTASGGPSFPTSELTASGSNDRRLDQQEVSRSGRVEAAGAG